MRAIYLFLILICLASPLLAAGQASFPFSQRLAESGSDSEFLDVDEAFIFSAEAKTRQSFVIRWHIADGYALYKRFIQVSIDSDQGNPAIADIQYPSGEWKDDAKYGRVEMYHGDIEISITLKQPPETFNEANVIVDFRGCAIGGICYPNHIVESPLFFEGLPELNLMHEAASGAPDQPDSPPPPTSTPQQQTLITAIIGAFGAGLLASFAACVYPMLFIISGIILGQGEHAKPLRSFLLSLVYVTAMASVYGAIGVATALLGSALNITGTLQNAWALIPFSLIFVVFAAAMFGLITIQVPGSIQTRLSQWSQRQKGGTWLGVAIMGLLSALIVGACSGPILVSLLSLTAESGDAVEGALRMLSYGYGMGAPLLLVGIGWGAILPRAGNWMGYVRLVSGFIMLGLAIFFISRILPSSASLALWATLLFSAAITLFIYPLRQKANRLAITIPSISGTFLFIYACLLGISAFQGGTDPLRPWQFISTSTSPAATALHFEKAESIEQLNSLIARAEINQQPVILKFSADWCTTCHQLETSTFTDSRVNSKLDRFARIHIDLTSQPLPKALSELKNQYRVFGPPTLIFIDPLIGSDEIPGTRIVGYISAENFDIHLHQLLVAFHEDSVKQP